MLADPYRRPSITSRLDPPARRRSKPTDDDNDEVKMLRKVLLANRGKIAVRAFDHDSRLQAHPGWMNIPETAIGCLIKNIIRFFRDLRAETVPPKKYSAALESICREARRLRLIVRH